MKAARTKSQFDKFILALIFLSGSQVMAQSKGGFFSTSGSKNGVSWSAKAEGRASSRWTLQEWLDQKSRNRLMDQWLSMNSSSPFEFSLKGSYAGYGSQKNSEEKKDKISYAGAFTAHALAVGLTGEYENNTEDRYHDITGMLNIRLLGNSLQTTSLTIHGGQRTRRFSDGGVDETIRNLFGQATLQLYFTKYFGAMGFYRQYEPENHGTLGKVEGSLSEAGLFIDFSGLRVYGNWFEDIQRSKTDAGVETKYKRQGLKSGIQIFF